MKKLLSVVAVVVGLGAVQLGGASVKDEIAKRLEPVGSVCVQGEDCAGEAPAAPVSLAASGGKSPEAIYNQSCTTCHAMGIAGAPKLGDVAQWAPRIEKGIEVLYDSVINGMPPGMPAKGMCFTCSDEELKAVTDYMVSASQ